MAATESEIRRRVGLDAGWAGSAFILLLFLVVLSVLLLAVFVLVSVALFLHAELCRKIFCYLPRLGTYYLSKHKLAYLAPCTK